MEDNARAGMLAVIRNAFAESSRFSMVPAKLQSVFYSVQDENLDTIHIMIDPLFENIILKETPCTVNVSSFPNSNTSSIVIFEKINICEIIMRNYNSPPDLPTLPASG